MRFDCPLSQLDPSNLLVGPGCKECLSEAKVLVSALRPMLVIAAALVTHGKRP
jgi:hypothetical protein